MRRCFVRLSRPWVTSGLLVVLTGLAAGCAAQSDPTRRKLSVIGACRISVDASPRLTAGRVVRSTGLRLTVLYPTDPGFDATVVASTNVRDAEGHLHDRSAAGIVERVDVRIPCGGRDRRFAAA